MTSDIMMGLKAFVEARARMRLKRATATAWSVALLKVFVLMTGGSFVSLEDIVMFPTYCTIRIGSNSQLSTDNRRPTHLFPLGLQASR